MIVISLLLGLAPRLVRRLKVETAEEKAVRAAFSKSIRNRREQETPVLQPEMQQSYNEFEANTKSIDIAVVRGQRPEFQPQVRFKIRDDSVRDISAIQMGWTPSVADIGYDQDTQGSISYKAPIYRLTQTPSSS